jgi:hypothetical protein
MDLFHPSLHRSVKDTPALRLIVDHPVEPCQLNAVSTDLLASERNPTFTKKEQRPFLPG